MIQRIDASTATLGEGMPIRRALPTARRRLIGAWCFLDHFGPASIAGTRGMRVGPHPHIGLQTVTWLHRGEILHRDSLGSVQRIVPGALNLMTAGRGISHSEESPEPHGDEIHGVQFWIALPERARRMAPAFVHHPSVPVVRRDDATISVLAGEWLGERSPAQVYSELVGADLQLPAGGNVTVPLRRDFEYGAIATSGEAVAATASAAQSERLAPGTLLYFAPGGDALTLTAGSAPASVILVGGMPLDEPVLMWWNFVARSQDELTAASRDWNAGAAHFGEVRGYDGPRLTAPLPPWSATPDAVVKYP